MGKTLIKIDCLDQRLIVTSAPTLASGGKNENVVEFNFCENWNGFEKVAVFYRDVKDPYKSTIDGNGRCVVPWEVLTSDGYIFFGVFGVKDDILRTSEILKYKIKLGPITEDLKPSDPTPELWEQILAGIADKVNVKQGAEHAGKVLGINEDGEVVPVIGGGSGAILDPTLSKAYQAAEAKAVGEALAKKVDAVEGMGLTSNDYTDDDKLAVEQNKIDIEDLKTDLNAFEKNRPFDLTGNPVQVETFEGMPLNPVTVLEPKQAGSGDPYPAGGGRNLIPYPYYAANGTTVGGVTFAYDNQGRITLNGTVASGQESFNVGRNFTLPAGNYVLSAKQGNTITRVYLYKNGTLIRSQAAADSAFAFDATESDVFILSAVALTGTHNNSTIEVQIEKGSSASEYAPPENIRPITGCDAVELNHAGKNLLPNTAVSVTKNGLTYTINNDGSVTVNGTCDSNSFFTICESVKLPQGEYILSGNPQGITYSQVRLYVDGYDSMTESHKITLETAQTLKVNIVVFRGEVLNNVVFKPMLRFASDTDATYAPYAGKLHTVQIGQTVYGGKFDWLTGKLVADRGLYTFTGDGGAKLLSASTYNGKCFLSDVIPNMVGNSGALNGAKSSHFVESVWNNIVNVAGGVDNYETPFDKFAITTSNKIGIAYDGTIDEANAWLAAQNTAGTPVQIAYKLATSIEIQLEPHEILALQGVNTLYGDDEINISGRSDMQAVVSHLLKRIAALESKANGTE